MLAAVCSMGASAQWNEQPGDVPLTIEQMQSRLPGKFLRYESGQVSVFKPDGSYEFHVGGKVYHYTYTFTDDGAVCITSPQYGSRCDLLVENNGTLFSINEKGQRYAAEVE